MPSRHCSAGDCCVRLWTPSLKEGNCYMFKINILLNILCFLGKTAFILFYDMPQHSRKEKELKPLKPTFLKEGVNLISSLCGILDGFVRERPVNLKTPDVGRISKLEKGEISVLSILCKEVAVRTDIDIYQRTHNFTALTFN